ncbi:hypothetical protein FE257_012806 [Aspergillus nanangensis]|uniref:glucose oxidase n=1 Tax=Aspergillus nanangensis TaxID=2582783 RepID=A0AAD4CFP0_ASPNN|nr:hypothetical protein FE257_012806 [Aspergillus nanangensis]
MGALGLATTAECLAPEHFDYVVIGGGTCGLTVANRLSETPGIRVAVIEAGGDERNNPNVTGVSGFGLGFNTAVDWQYETTAQVYANNQAIVYHAGKALGGTSTINGMTYIRAGKEEIDMWEESLGNKGWNWNNLYPYYLKSEGFSPPTEAQRAAGASFVDAYHGRQGPLDVSYPYGMLNGSFHSVVNDTWRQLGIPFNPDVNGGNLHGFSVWPQTLDREANIREDAAMAYYYPISDRKNLVTYRGVVDRILWDDKSSKGKKVVASGVQYVNSDGVTKTVLATKEVIVSAGAVRSPAILELSGIGNPQILHKYNIPTKVALHSVGENAQDQPNNAILFTTNQTLNGTAPYVTYATVQDLFGSETDAIAKKTADSLNDWADQTIQANEGVGDVAALKRLLKTQHDMIFTKGLSCVEILTSSSGHNMVSAFWISFPFSRGSVHIRSSNPQDYPQINPNYFLVDWDVTLQTKIAETAFQFWNTSPVHSMVVTQTSPPPETVPPNATATQLTSWLKSSFSANHHLLGTAAMLPRELGGVVDETLTVYGTENVRVIDASVLPIQVSGHLTSTLYAVSERAADIIKGVLE